MFEILSEKLNKILRNLGNKGKLKDKDIDDALRAGIIDEIPSEYLAAFGDTHGARINTMIGDVVDSSYGKDAVCMSDDMEEQSELLRQFMFKNVYFGSVAKQEEGKAEQIIRLLFGHFCDNPSGMGGEHERIERFGLTPVITDYIAGMTDRYAVKVFEDIYIPKGWKKY